MSSLLLPLPHFPAAAPIGGMRAVPENLRPSSLTCHLLHRAQPLNSSQPHALLPAAYDSFVLLLQLPNGTFASDVDGALPEMRAGADQTLHQIVTEKFGHTENLRVIGFTYLKMFTDAPTGYPHPWPNSTYPVIVGNIASYPNTVKPTGIKNHANTKAWWPIVDAWLQRNKEL